MIWLLGTFLMIQASMWMYFILHKKYKPFAMTGLLDGLLIWAFIDSYLKYVYVNPCDGIEGDCFNETGMIFIFIIFGMIIMTIVTFYLFIQNKSRLAK